MQDAENALFGFGGKNILSAAKVQLVWYTMWDPNICLQEAVFFLSSLSQGQGTLVGFHRASTTEWVWLHRTNLGPFDITLRNHEVRGRLFLPRHKGVIFRPVRTAANNELSGPWYHVRFHTRQLHSGAEQKGSRRNICGEGTACPGHAMQGEFDAF